MKIRTETLGPWAVTRYLYPQGFERYATRALEGYLAIFDIFYGTLLMMTYWDTMEAQIYQPLLNLLPEGAWGALFVLRGVFHLGALYINGRAWWTPYVRAFASATSTLFWTGFGIALLFAPVFTPGLIFSLAVMAVPTHLYCLRRSGRDAGMARRTIQEP
jgi:hypothetical protein